VLLATSWHDTLISAGKEMAQLVEKSNRSHYCQRWTGSSFPLGPGQKSAAFNHKKKVKLFTAVLDPE